ncbi:MAG: SHOCT domain-containing protein [Candidatus Caccovivens sp.]
MKINLKLYFKIMSNVMLIFGILWCCTIVGLIWGIPIIIGSREMKKAENYSIEQLKRNNLTLLVWVIVFGAFTSPVGLVAVVFGVFVYNMIEQEKTDGKVEIIIEERADNETEKIKEKIEELDKLHKAGIITDNEYNQMRKKILGL